MKKLLTLCLLLATTFTLKAQEMSFEETVKYINDKIIIESLNYNIVADKNGNVTVKGSNKRFNFFDLDTNINRYSLISDELGFFLTSYYNGEGGPLVYQLCANVDKGNSVLISNFSSLIEAKRVFKALLHLRSLCTKKKDPFDK